MLKKQTETKEDTLDHSENLRPLRPSIINGYQLFRRSFGWLINFIFMVQFEHFRCPLHRYTFFRPGRYELGWKRFVKAAYLTCLQERPCLLLTRCVMTLIRTCPPGITWMRCLFLRSWQGEPFATILLDPPYAFRKSMELYKGHTFAARFANLKTRFRVFLRPEGIVITFGYHSVVMGCAERVCNRTRPPSFRMAVPSMTLSPQSSGRILNSFNFMEERRSPPDFL